MLFCLSFSTTRDKAELLAQTFPKDSLEYKLLLRYTQKKKSTHSHTPQSNGVAEAKGASPEQHRNRRKPQKKKRSFLKIISCIRPEKEDDDHATKPCRKLAAAGSREYQNTTLRWFINDMTIIEHITAMYRRYSFIFVGHEVMKQTCGIVPEVFSLINMAY